MAPHNPDPPTPPVTSGADAQALVEAEARNQAVLDTIVDGVITIDERAVIESANPAACRIFGYEATELIGRNVSVLMPEPFQGEHDEYMNHYLRTGERRIIDIGREVVGRRKDGGTFPMDLAVSELWLRDRRIFTGVVRDITDRRRLEQEVLQIGADERRRIGQDLHDGLQQQLAATAFAVQRLENRASRNPAPPDFDAAEELTKVHEMVDAAIAQMRDIARGLYPVKLEADGLAAGLAELADGLRQVFGIDCTFDAEEGTEVPDPIAALHLYRIAQEAANNAIRHGEARTVKITLRREAAALVVAVADDGSGFDPAAIYREQPRTSSRRGMGLHTMSYRARMVGCTFAVQPREGGGTLVRCAMPVSPIRPNDDELAEAAQKGSASDDSTQTDE